MFKNLFLSIALMISQQLIAGIATETTTPTATWQCFAGAGGTGTSAAVAVKVTRAGRMVSIFFPAANITVATTTCGYFGYNALMPTWARPSTNLYIPTMVQVGGASSISYVLVRSDGNLDLYKDLANGQWPVGTNNGHTVPTSISYNLP